MQQISSRYDISNYSSSISLIIDRPDYPKIETELFASLLLIKWQLLGKFKVQLNQQNLIGTIRIYRVTPLGELEPIDYQLKVSDTDKQYIQFIDIPYSEFRYKIKVSNPTGVVKSKLQIFEYKQPSNMPPSFDNVSLDLSGLTAATTGNATALGAIAQTLSVQPDLIADAIANNKMLVDNLPIVAVGIAVVTALLPDRTRQAVSLKNQSTGNKIKLWICDILPAGVTSYSSDGYIVELIPGGSYECQDKEGKSSIFAVSNTAGAKLAITTTRTAP
jgi:hypothetical protein